jgi:FAD binding domain
VRPDISSQATASSAEGCVCKMSRLDLASFPVLWLLDTFLAHVAISACAGKLHRVFSRAVRKMVDRDQSGGADCPVVTSTRRPANKGVRMSEDQREEALRTLERSFGDRLKPGSMREEDFGAENSLASALPMSAEEVELLAQVASRHSVPLVAVGAGTTSRSGSHEHAIAVRFDLMRHTRLPDEEQEWWVEAEPGVPWLQLDDQLRVGGRGLAVYPASAPRATVGG